MLLLSVLQNYLIFFKASAIGDSPATLVLVFTRILFMPLSRQRHHSVAPCLLHLIPPG